MISNETYLTKLLLKSEGGYTNDEGDPGGPTNFGITIHDVRKYLKPSATAEDVKRLTLDQAIQIYDKHYWDPMLCDDWRSGLDYVVYDYGVNSGVGRPPRVLQKILGLPVTGQMNNTLVTRANSTNVDKLIDAVCDERLHFMKQIRGGDAWRRFGRGWDARVASVRKTAHNMAKAAPVLMPVEQHPVTQVAKATNVDPKLSAKMTTATGVSGATAGLASGAGSHDTLITAAVVAGVVVVVGGVGYMIYRSQHNKQNAVELPPGMVPLLPPATEEVTA